MLEGTGTSECRLTGISYTDAVTVGDTVVSADINGVRGPRLFFGTVTSANFWRVVSGTCEFNRASHWLNWIRWGLCG